MMKSKSHIVVLASFLLFLIPTLAHGQEDVIHMNHEELGKHERPIVTFPHAKHEDNIECTRCHHDFDKYGVNTGSEGEPCLSCHGVKKGLLPPKEAFHLQCINCHRNLLRNGFKSGPITCAECHKKTRQSSKE